MRFDRETFFAIAPFAVWMAMMTLLPATAEMYALRTVCTAAAAFALLPRLMKPSLKDWGRFFIMGVPAGMLVLVLWIWPESFAWYREWFVIGGVSASQEPSAYDPAVCGKALLAMRLLGSAFVIAPVEELFFRSYLYRRLQSREWTKVSLSRFDLTAFLWTVALFSLEHNRIAAALAAGVVYQIVAMRAGIGSAITAHVTTNLALGLWVVYNGAWAFW